MATTVDAVNLQTSSDRSVPRARVNAGDTRIDRRGRSRTALPILSYGFRPFFLLGATYAALMVPLWIWMLAGGAYPSGSLIGPAWHAHEMMFGFLGAVMAGFILTAVPNWTGRLPLSGWRLAVLVGLWLVGRIAVSTVPSPVPAALLDLAFPVALAGAVWREVLAGRNYRNIPIALLLSLFAAANGLDHLGAHDPAWHGYGMRLALGVAAVLIAVVGGRITPSFTRNWMARIGLEPLPAPMDRLDRIALAATVAAMAAWVVMPDATLSGLALLFAGALLTARLARWRGQMTWREPIVLALHVGYLWLAAALVLLGVAVAMPWLLPATSAIHALTAGAVGTMTLAVMTRASLGHTGRAVAANPATLAIYGLVTGGAILRVAAPLTGEFYLAAIVLSSGLWSGAFGLFLIVYGPMLMRHRIGAD